MPRSAIGLLPGRGFAPFIKVVDRHQAAPALERFAECRLVLDPLGLGIDIGEADLDVLGPVRDQAPAQHVEAALPGLGVVADDGQLPSGRNSGARGAGFSSRTPRRDDLRDLNRIERQLDRSFLRRRAVRGDPVLASASSIQTGA